jgi:hypothetical protein
MKIAESVHFLNSPQHSSSDGKVAKLRHISVYLFSTLPLYLVQRRRVGRDIAAASRVLGSLSRTVLALPNLEMPDVIGEQVRSFLQAWS